eukprot:6843578-Prorocentrum_lima.AAC.1
MGLHVDDYVGAIENVESFEHLEEKTYPSETGAARLQSLVKRFSFGKIDFGTEQFFCGGWQ